VQLVPKHTKGTHHAPVDHRHLGSIQSSTRMIMPNESRTAGLPRAPAMRRRIALTRKQWIGLPVLAVVPVLALAGVFGERSTTTAARSTTIQIFVRYPERFRYRQVQSLEVSVRNVSTSPLDTVRVALDTSYVTRFAAVRIEPAPRTAFVVALTNLKPGGDATGRCRADGRSIRSAAGSRRRHERRGFSRSRATHDCLSV